MCGRYSLAPDQSKEIAQIVAEVQARFGAASIHTGEIFPTNTAPILLLDGQKMIPKPMTWGFPSFKGKGVIINARGETALDKPIHAGTAVYRAYDRLLRMGYSKKEIPFSAARAERALSGRAVEPFPR